MNFEKFLQATRPNLGVHKYSDDEQRDDHGRWTSGGGSGITVPRYRYKDYNGHKISVEKRPDGRYHANYGKHGESVETNRTAPMNTAERAYNAATRAIDNIGKPGTFPGRNFGPGSVRGR